jgi:DNA-binding transcriptional ArsR family regulator
MPNIQESQNRFKATIYHALSDPIRLEILDFLREGEKCVCEIIPYLNIIQPVVSRHLKILKDAGLIRCRKDGTKRMYSIVDQHVYDSIEAITPELIIVLQREIMAQMSCGPIREE